MENEKEDRIKDVLRMDDSDMEEVTAEEVVKSVVSDVGENIVDEVLEEVVNEVEDDMVKDVFTEVEELVETQHIIEDNKKTEKNSFSHCGLILNEETEKKIIHGKFTVKGSHVPYVRKFLQTRVT